MIKWPMIGVLGLLGPRLVQSLDYARLGSLPGPDQRIPVGDAARRQTSGAWLAEHLQQGS